MKGVHILLVTAIVVCVGNRTQGVHRHRQAKTGHKPERDTGSIILKPGTAKNKLFPGCGTNFRYIGEVKNGLDRVTVVTSIPIPKYSDIQISPIIFNNCTEDLWRHGARTRGYRQHETYKKCQGPTDRTKPNDKSDPYETEFTAKAWNDTAQIRGRRGFGSILAKAILGLITQAIESVSSHIKGKQQQRINTAVEELRNDDNKIRNDLRQHRNELLMYGRYNLNSLRGVINATNALHERQTYLKEQ